MTVKEEQAMIKQMQSSALEWEEVDRQFQKLGRERDAALSKLVGKPFSNGFTIHEGVAENIIAQQDPSKLRAKASKYTIETIDGITMLVAMDETSKVLYCIEMPVEEDSAPEYTYLDQTLGDVNNSNKKLKLLNAISYIVVGALVVGAIVFLYVNN